MTEFLIIAALIASALAIGVVSWLAELVARLAGFPFGAMNWLLHGLGFLVMMPFVLALMVLTNGLATETWWVGGMLLAAALFSFVGGGVKLVFEILRGGHGRAGRVGVIGRR